jgi:hypothetical protein
VHAPDSASELFAVDLVTIAQEIRGRSVVREGVYDLLGGPVSAGVLGHVEVDDAPAMMSEHDEDEQDPQARGGHGEEINRDEVLDMIGEEGPPGLRGRGPPRRYEPGDGAFSDVDAELQELPVDAGSTP